MKTSYLTKFAKSRLDSLELVDKKAYPEAELSEKGLFSDRPKELSSFLSRKGSLVPNVLFEVKKASPTLGKITEVNSVELCGDFIRCGAKAISVLVDSANFGGHPNDIRDCVESFPELPFLWKDFVMTEYQVRLAKHLGASSVLLMTQLLEPKELIDLYELALALEVEPFVETHTEEQLSFALDLGARFIGINARDFEVSGLPIDLRTASRIVKAVGATWPEDKVLVAQSGIATADDLSSVLSGFSSESPDAVQIGSSVSGKNGMDQDLKRALNLAI